MSDPKPYQADADGGRALWHMGALMQFKATSEETGNAFWLAEQTSNQGYASPVHLHTREDETFYVLDGEMLFRCGDEELTAGPGTTVLLPQGVPHGFFNPGEEPVRMLNLMAPGGGEGYFRDTGRPAEGEGLPPAGPIDPAAYLEHGPRYGTQVVGPPIRMPQAALAG
jgi:mannose-6-phosphate isomerase-like protein (cupin superfamily)